MQSNDETPLERAIRLAGGMTALVRALNERGKDIKSHATIYQWKLTRVPADYCPDIEAITAVKCEELRSDVNWAVLRAAPGKASSGKGADSDAAAPSAAPQAAPVVRSRDRRAPGREGPNRTDTGKPSNRKGR